MTNKTDVVRARIESRVKKDAEIILNRIGVSHSTFINMSYRAMVEEGGIPLSLHIPNRETARALRDAKDVSRRSTYASHTSLDSFVNSLQKKRKK